MTNDEGQRTKDKIHFAHANGFPARTYSKLFTLLEDDFEVGFIARHAHNPKFPVTDNWKFLKDELKTEIENRYTQPVVGIGHSLGGVLHFLVAVENPELYQQIILLDAPVISRLSSRGLQFLKLTKLIDRFSPAQATKFRRNHWQTKEEVYEHFKSKPKFEDFDEDVLRDYAEHATVETDKGLRLFFKPSVETKIYRTIPHTLPKFKGKLKVPAAYVGGSRSREGKLARLSFMKKHFPIDFYTVEGSHLFPLEKPFETVQMIKKILSEPTA